MHVTPELRAFLTPRSGAEIKEIILAKGWTISATAALWGVSRQRLYQVFKQKSPALLWQCAAQGLPEPSSALLSLAKERSKEKPGHHRPSQKPAATIITNAAGYAVGDILVAMEHIGQLAEEGDEGVLVAIKRAGNYWNFLVRFGLADEWFAEEFLARYMANTGRTKKAPTS